MPNNKKTGDGQESSRVIIGQFFISPYSKDSIWIGKNGGEGMELKKSILLKHLEIIYSEQF